MSGQNYSRDEGDYDVHIPLKLKSRHYKSGLMAPSVVEYADIITEAKTTHLGGSKKSNERKIQRPKKSRIKSNKEVNKRYNDSFQPVESSILAKKNVNALYNIDKIINSSRESITTTDVTTTQTLKLRIQGQLQTIRILETQLSDVINVLRLKNKELDDFKLKHKEALDAHKEQQRLQHNLKRRDETGRQLSQQQHEAIEKLQASS